MKPIDDLFSLVVDHFADALKFAKEAEYEQRQGRTAEVKKFAELARQAAHSGLTEMDRATA